MWVIRNLPPPLGRSVPTTCGRSVEKHCAKELATKAYTVRGNQEYSYPTPWKCVRRQRQLTVNGYVAESVERLESGYGAAYHIDAYTQVRCPL